MATAKEKEYTSIIPLGVVEPQTDPISKVLNEVLDVLRNKGWEDRSKWLGFTILEEHHTFAISRDVVANAVARRVRYHYMKRQSNPHVQTVVQHKDGETILFVKVQN